MTMLVNTKWSMSFVADGETVTQTWTFNSDGTISAVNSIGRHSTWKYSERDSNFVAQGANSSTQKGFNEVIYGAIDGNSGSGYYCDFYGQNPFMHTVKLQKTQ